MGIAKGKLSFRAQALGIISITFLITSGVEVADARPLQIAKSVTNTQKKVLVQDFVNSDLSLNEDKGTEALLGVSDLNSATLKAWVTARVGYVVGESETSTDHVVDIQKYQYPNDILPFVEEPLQRNPRPAPAKLKPGERYSTVMSNVGTLVYDSGKKDSVLKGYKFVSDRGQTIIPVTSPRVGILRMGEGFIDSHPEYDGHAFVQKWFRIQTLFHEAHHSDGSKSEVGFNHTRCPEGHLYADKLACDWAGNGPYGVGEAITRAALQTCLAKHRCSEKEAEMLRVLMTDNHSRILDETLVDPSPEGVVNETEGHS